MILALRPLLMLLVVAVMAGELAASELLPTSAHGERLVGTAGCAATNCHGGQTGPGSEFTHWALRDKAHQRAYDVLLSEASQTMAGKLGIKAAHEDARCLACHLMPLERESAATTSAASHFHLGLETDYGVGCESCHGAAGKWLPRHAERTWRSMSPQEKESLGFRDLKSLSARADSCVACHVGSPAATVDHDLIAAGHPRLTFEFSAYHAMLPKHWNAAAERQRDPALEVRLLALGHAASAKAMSDIAAARADIALKRGAKHIAPDLAEFDCHACHHDLAEEAWRGTGVARGRLGVAQWGPWTVAPAKWLAGESKASLQIDATSASESLNRLFELMTQSRLGVVAADKLLTESRQAALALTTWQQALATAPLDAASARRLLDRLISESADREWTSTWDGRAQRYLAIAATHQSLRNSDLQTTPTALPHALKPIPQRLQFPAGFNTPRRYSPDELDRLFRELRSKPQ